MDVGTRASFRPVVPVLRWLSAFLPPGAPEGRATVLSSPIGRAVMAEREYRCPQCGNNFLIPPDMAEPVLCPCRHPYPVMELVTNG